MPRNCGCSSRCDCIINEGAGITVTGRGSPDHPYVITADGGGGGGGSGFDPGDLKWSARPSAPAGWLVCDGAAVSRSTYADLFTAIGTLYGPGDGTSTFNLPDFTGRFMLGADSSHPHGSSSGSETKTLSAAQMPAHNHGTQHYHDISHDHPAVSSSAAGAHDHSTSSSVDTTSRDSGHFQQAGTSGAVTNNNLVGTAAAHAHTVDIPTYYGTSGYSSNPVSDSAGGGQPINIMPPYTAALPLIKT